MKTIHAYALTPTDKVQGIKMRVGAKILCVQLMFGIPYIYAEINPVASFVTRFFLVYQNGEKLGEKKATYIGSYVIGSFTFHVYDTGR